MSGKRPLTLFIALGSSRHNYVEGRREGGRERKREGRRERKGRRERGREREKERRGGGGRERGRKNIQNIEGSSRHSVHIL